MVTGLFFAPFVHFFISHVKRVAPLVFLQGFTRFDFNCFKSRIHIQVLYLWNHPCFVRAELIFGGKVERWYKENELLCFAPVGRFFLLGLTGWIGCCVVEVIGSMGFPFFILQPHNRDMLVIFRRAYNPSVKSQSQGLNFWIMQDLLLQMLPRGIRGS